MNDALLALFIFAGLFLGAGYFFRKSAAALNIFAIVSAGLFLYFYSGFSPVEFSQKSLFTVGGKLALLPAAAFVFYWTSHRPMFGIPILFIFLFIPEIAARIFPGDAAAAMNSLQSAIRPIGYSYVLFRLYDAVYSIKVEGESGKLLQRFFNKSFLLYVFYFPALLCGPVLLHGDIRIRPRAFSLKIAFFRRSTALVLLGLVKIFILVPFIQMRFETGLLLPLQFTVDSLRNIFTSGFYNYASLYLDFSGYTDIIVGVSGLLGVRIPHNFRRPYLAGSVSEFWRRWHITLGAFVRKHIYFPLGGSRQGAGRHKLALMISMLAVGLWHGMSPHFIIWGAVHGAALALESQFPKRREPVSNRKNRKIPDKVLKISRILLTQIFIALTWVIFFLK